jgi:type II secretory pathway pseudopilin PulG
MQFGNFRRIRRSATQDGYMLLVVLLMVFFMALAAMAVAPSVVQQARRDKEQEMIHRGAQYARAIKKYVRKFGRYPTRLEELENTNNIRFLRQRYKDPMSPDGKGEWHLIHYGEVQMGAGGVGGIGGLQGAPPAGGAGRPAGQSPSAFGGPTTPGQSQSAFGGAFSGGTFGGGPIIGVSSTSEKQSLREFNGKNHYNQWQFIYDPTTDRGGLITGPYQPLQQLMPGAQTPGTPTVGTPAR